MNKVNKPAALFKKTPVVLALFTLVLLLLYLGFQPWISYKFEAELTGHEFLDVSGSSGFSFFTPIVIALLAITAVIMISGKIPRIILGILIVVMNGFLVTQLLPLITGEKFAILNFGRETVAQNTGLQPTLKDTVYLQADLTFFAYCSLFSSILLVLVGAVVIIFSAKWATGGRKFSVESSSKNFESSKRSNKPDRISDWDALSHGDDPSL